MGIRRTYRVEVLPEFNRDGRGISFLMSPDDRHVDASEAYEDLSQNGGFAVRTRFEAWLDYKKNDRWFHGWPSHPSYRDCFVFKWKENRLGQRLYGFLCKPSTQDPAYQLCVLVLHAIKKEKESDTSELNRVVERTTDTTVQAAVKLRAFRKKKKG